MLTPLWSNRRPEPHPPLVGAVDCEVCVVGGGVTGLLTALLLARAGRSVVLLEGRRLGAGATGHTTGKVSVLQGARLSRIASRNPAGVLRGYVAANREGQAWLRRFCHSHGVAVQDRPAHTYATTRRGELRARLELAACRRAGLSAVWSDELDLPFPTRGGVRVDGQFQLHPMELVEALSAQLVAAGGTVHEDSRVRSVQREGDRWAVQGRTTTVRADRVVIATGMPILDRGGYFARQEPERSYAAAFRTSWTAPGMYLSVDPDARSIRSGPTGAENLVLVGGNGHTTGRGPGERRRLDDLLAWARGALPVDEPTHTWSAQDFSPATALPYVGPLLPGEDGLLTATGYEKWGFANAAAAALALTATVQGDRPPGWASALRSWTPREVAGLPTLARFNGGVGLHLAAGWARRALTPGDRAPVCTHLGGVLRWNDAEESWDCPLHGSRFADDGAVLEGPATRPLGDG